MTAEELDGAAKIVKEFLELIPDPLLRTAVEAGLSLLVAGAEQFMGKNLTPDEFRAQLADHLRANWQKAIDEKFAPSA